MKYLYTKILIILFDIKKLLNLKNIIKYENKIFYVYYISKNETYYLESINVKCFVKFLDYKDISSYIYIINSEYNEKNEK